MPSPALPALLLVSLCAVTPLHSATHRVKFDATGTGNGTSWANAFPKLQDALAAAAAGDVIWVAAGIYYPDEGGGQTNNDRTSSFTLDQDISVYGGFNGTETIVLSRNPAVNITVLSGDLDQNDGSKDAAGVITDPDLITGSNSHHVVSVTGASTDALLSGFTITGGLGETDGIGDVDETGRGAGVYAYWNGSLDMNLCRIQGNFSHYGGGLYLQGSNATVSLCSFMANRALARGGGYYGLGGSAITFRSCVFGGNHSVRGGGAYIGLFSTNQFVNCTFHGNSGGDDLGSAIYDEGSASEFTNSVVWNVTSIDGPLDEINNNGTSSLTFSHTLVQHHNLSATGSNFDGTNPANDPLFLDPISPSLSPQVWNDFRQASNSSLNDQGNNSANLLIVDIVERARLFNGVIDLGAVEYQPRIWRVNDDATGANNGTSWVAAFDDLQDALAAAINGDEIWIAGGIYRPGDGTNRSASFVIDKTIRLYGGFAGTETNKDQRAPSTNLTVLSGDLDQNDVTNAAGITTDPANLTGNNAFIVCKVGAPVNQGYNTDPVLLTGLIFTGGLGGPSGGGLGVGSAAHDTEVIACRIRGNSSTDGGGLAANLGSRKLLLENVIVRNNHAASNGGGMNLISAVTDPANPAISLIDVEFLENTCDGNGGAVWHSGALGLSGCDFDDNDAVNAGGALSATFGAKASITACSFTSNTAGTGGALALEPDTGIISGSSFDLNSATIGGAIHASTGLIVTNCSFTGNEMTGAVNGGGAIKGGSATITSSNFSSNNTASWGGALYLSSGDSHIENCGFFGNEAVQGGAAKVFFANADFVNCAFGGNKGSNGGGVYFDNSTASSLLNCSFQGNSATFGGGIMTSASTLAITNTVVWGNAENGSLTTPGASIYSQNSSTVTYTHSLLRNLNPAGTGNLNGTNVANDPDFVGPTIALSAPSAGGNLRLQAVSPVIDQGLNSANTTSFELDGLLRIAGAAIDLGAYEFGSTSLVTFASLYPALSPDGDENSNGLTNYLDYALGTDPTAPFDPSGSVLLESNTLTLPARSNASDVFATWEKSATLMSGSWDELIEGVDYTLISVSGSGTQSVTEINLLGPTPPIFFRQSFTTTP